MAQILKTPQSLMRYYYDSDDKQIVKNSCFSLVAALYRQLVKSF